MKTSGAWLAAILAVAGFPAGAGEPAMTDLAEQFLQLPMEARRLTGPLFWLHGDESRERLETYLEKVAEGGNGCFTAESRPHSDWLGPNWYRDLDICLQAAKRLNLKMWIFDERWWPSGEVAGRVPEKYGSKTMEAAAVAVEGPKPYSEPGYDAARLIAVLAAREVEGGLDGGSLVDLGERIKDGTLSWEVPAGKWRILKFTWKYSPGRRLVDGASRDAVEWYIQTVYQPHYDRFKEDFGGTIAGYFYDEPETPGDWGTEVIPLLKERGVDWKKALAAWKFTLAGEEHAAAKYQYQDAFAEAWGRTFYGGLSKWCREHKVVSMGHFLEHGWEYLQPRLCAGNMFQLQKYSDMGGIDLVCRQFYPGQKNMGLWQMSKLGSSIAHVYHKANDLAMCEMFGAYGQDITYPQMKWLTDQMQVRGVSFMIPHSFNPRAPFDGDCPPYFYDGGYEPRWPLYRVYADYSSRLSLMLSGGRHAAPVAFLFLGNSRHVGKSVPPEELTTALDDALLDCDWMPYDVFEQDAKLAGREIALHEERYRVLIVPPVEVIPYGALAGAREFFEAGGVVIGYDFLPTKSATLGKTAADIAAARAAVWGPAPASGLAACKTSAAGGRSYFLPARPKPADLTKVFTDAGVRPAIEVVEGETGNWLHVLHRVKAGRDVFLVCNQNHTGAARRFTFRITADGEPEVWEPMSGAIMAAPCRRLDGKTVEIALAMEPMESILLGFQPTKRTLPPRWDHEAAPVREPVVVVRDSTAKFDFPSFDGPPFEGCAWMWYPERESALSAPPGTRWLRGSVSLPAGRRVKTARMTVSVDNEFVLYVNGGEAGRCTGDENGWRKPRTMDVTKLLKPGTNVLAIAATNGGTVPNPAGAIGVCRIEFDQGEPQLARIDGSWKAADKEQPGWEKADFDDRAWVPAKDVVPYGQGPWGNILLGGRTPTLGPLRPDPFLGRCALPGDVDLKACRVYLEMDELPPPEIAAAVKVNGRPAGGVIGRPFRMDVTRLLRPGDNTIEIVPVSPKNARLAFYGRNTQ